MNRSLLTLVAAGLTLGSSLASAATLDLRTGLWEVTSTGETTGMPPVPPEVLAKMTPEQRAQMMAAMGAASKPTVVRSCITAKTLERGLNFNRMERPNCTQTTTNSSSRQVDVRLQCTGEQPMHGTFHIEAVDRQTMSGQLDMAVSSGANTMTMKRTMQGKWLSSNCGDVKPQEE